MEGANISKKQSAQLSWACADLYFNVIFYTLLGCDEATSFHTDGLIVELKQCHLKQGMRREVKDKDHRKLWDVHKVNIVTRYKKQS
jgi:hypothetical protein